MLCEQKRLYKEYPTVVCIQFVGGDGFPNSGLLRSQYNGGSSIARCGERCFFALYIIMSNLKLNFKAKKLGLNEKYC